MRGLRRVGGKRGIDRGLDRARIADLPQAFGFDDRGGVGAGLNHCGEDILGDAAGNRALGDQVDQGAEPPGGDGRSLNPDLEPIQPPAQIAHDPVGRQLRIAAFRGGLEIFGRHPFGHEHRRVFRPQSVIRNEPRFSRIRQFRQFGA